MSDSTALDFEYDVAFSFLKGDEPTAVNLADSLADRYRSFVYAKKQEEIVGTDGQETFPEVFGKRARCVVVLYRDEWGTTPWTRIEQTTIQNRAMRDGWNFLLFIKLAPGATTPKWLPHSYIWHDYERYGPAGAAGAISSLVQRFGGAPRTESLDDKAERLRRDIAFEQKRKHFLGSDQGVQAARASVGKLLAGLEERAARLSLKFKRANQPYEGCVIGQSTATMVALHLNYGNSLDGSFLEASIWNGHPPMSGTYFPFERPRQIGGGRYEFDLTSAEEHVWRPTSGRRERVFLRMHWPTRSWACFWTRNGTHTSVNEDSGTPTTTHHPKNPYGIAPVSRTPP
jgi:hypothetical protein